MAKLIPIVHHSSDDRIENSSLTIPILEETLEVTKEFVDKAKVRLVKTVQEHTETIEVPFAKEEIGIKRVAKNEFVDVIPEGVRYEGDVMIIPVLKEVAVVVKRIMLVEEIHVTKLRYEEKETRDIVVRKEQVNVERSEIHVLHNNE